MRCGVSMILERLFGTLVAFVDLDSLGVEKDKGGDDFSSSSKSKDSTGEGSLLPTTAGCVGFGGRCIDREEGGTELRIGRSGSSGFFVGVVVWADAVIVPEVNVPPSCSCSDRECELSLIVCDGSGREDWSGIGTVSIPPPSGQNPS